MPYINPPPPEDSDSDQEDPILTPATTRPTTPVRLTSPAPEVQESNTRLHSVHPLVKAIYSYTPEQSTELGLDPGDVLEVFEVSERGWTWGKCLASGRNGWFPSTYTEDLDAEERDREAPEEDVQQPQQQ